MAEIKRLQWTYHLFPDTLAKFPVPLGGIIQNRGIILFYLRNNENLGELSFILFKVGCIYDPCS